ncbi:hypothetical protein EJB05_11973 [Eragrostis curvula]|uniref:FBD domain-containing protein n=1 Tax=Eragrostis curvula TaxID=38414 RepID=A0A5J9VSP1_9POAL|nr:hypothetical protein EJB05_11973 [Eragrostis curvula]
MSRHDHDLREEEELEIPSCGGATRILLNLDQRWRLRFQLGGLFAALSHLTILSARVEGSDLSCLVSTMCPCLESLLIGVSVTLPTVSGVSMRTDSLQSLLFYANTRRLEVIAPRLQQLTLCDVESHMISAPKLAKLHWNGNGHDPRQHEFADVPCHLQLLKINRKSVVASLLQRFDSVDELKLGITVPREGYRSFLNETDRLPKCETLSVSVLLNHHGLVPVLLHLLRRCCTTRKLSIGLYNSDGYHTMYSCPSSCPCHLAKNCKIPDITLRSLEEVEISNFTSSPEELKFVEQLSRCNAAVLKRIIIRYTRWPHTPLTKDVCEKVRSKCRANLDVEFYVSSDMKNWVSFD